MLEKWFPDRPCFCGSGRPYRECHQPSERRMREMHQKGISIPNRKLIRTQEQLQGIRESAQVNIAVLDAVALEIREGIPLSRIDEIVYDVTLTHGAKPAPLHYQGYPYSTCVSVNDQVCHGFPKKDVYLREGDILNVDCSTNLHGFFSDASRMFEIGDVGIAKHRLVTETRACLLDALEKVEPWKPIGVMSAAIQRRARRNDFCVVTDYGGHGCGRKFHEDPFIDYGFSETEGMLMVPGMTFTIEPMINMGSPGVREEGWEVYTKDGKPSAQWEVQVLVTENGHELLCW